MLQVTSLKLSVLNLKINLLIKFWSFNLLINLKEDKPTVP